jgi:hypothetical protein
MRKSAANKPPRPVFHTPTQMDWTDDKLATLSEDQLVTLLGNLRTQRESGRVKEDTADDLARRINARLPTRLVNILKKRASLAEASASAES